MPSPEYIQELQARGWEGNVRELRNEADKFILGLPESSPTNTKNGVQLSMQQALENPPTGLNNQLALIEKSLITTDVTNRPTGISMKSIQCGRADLHGTPTRQDVSSHYDHHATTGSSRISANTHGLIQVSWPISR